MEQIFGPRQWKLFQESTAISAPILPREREISLAHAQRCSFLIMEQCCGPLAVEIVPGKHCDFRTYLGKGARAQSGANAEVQFSDYGSDLWPLAVKMFPGQQCDFSTYLGKRARAQSGSCAEVQFPDYGTEMLSPVSRNGSRKALRFQHLSCQESQSSVWRMRRGAFS
jgi:hypothetical protein